MPIDLSSLAHKHGLPLSANSHAAECPGGRIVAWGESELAYTGQLPRRMPQCARVVYRRESAVTLVFAPKNLRTVLGVLALGA